MFTPSQVLMFTTMCALGGFFIGFLIAALLCASRRSDDEMQYEALDITVRDAIRQINMHEQMVEDLNPSPVTQSAWSADLLQDLRKKLSLVSTNG